MRMYEVPVLRSDGVGKALAMMEGLEHRPESQARHAHRSE
jgi:hypothetical protein